MWQPTATLQVLQTRAVLLEATRLFFKSKNILEIDTPVLGQAPVTDPFLTALTTKIQYFADQVFYLQTSPEYYLKRLIAAYPISCYQLGKCFRDDEYGRYHSPEFTMLEWYRIDFDDAQLMEEVGSLINTLAVSLGLAPIQVAEISYREAFENFLKIDPHTVTLEDLQRIVKAKMGEVVGLSDLDRDTALQLLMAEIIEPELAKRAQPIFVYHFPASQAALAKVKILSDGTRVAARFELYWQGVELANGYHELVSFKEQQQRFEADLQKRSNLHLPSVPVDQNLLAALEKGVAECAGVALGFDRLIMVLLHKTKLAEVQTFFKF